MVIYKEYAAKSSVKLLGLIIEFRKRYKTYIHISVAFLYINDSQSETKNILNYIKIWNMKKVWPNLKCKEYNCF